MPRASHRAARALSALLVLVAALGAAPAAGSVATKTPPWISIESPPNPYDIATRNAFLVVRAFTDRGATSMPITGVAYGVVNGEKQSIPLRFERLRAGGFSLAKQWPSDGVWTLVINVSAGQGDADIATALVELAPSGEIASVRVPTRQDGSALVPRRVTSEEIMATLDRK